MWMNLSAHHTKTWRCPMKGYVTDSGYMGYVDGRYVLFANEGDYIDYCSE